MNDKLQKVMNPETKDIYFLVPNRQKRFIEGEEFVCVKKTFDDKSEYYIRRKNLIMNVK